MESPSQFDSLHSLRLLQHRGLPASMLELCGPKVLDKFQFKTNVAKLDVMGEKLLGLTPAPSHCCP